MNFTFSKIQPKELNPILFIIMHHKKNSFANCKIRHNFWIKSTCPLIGSNPVRDQLTG